VEAQTVFESCGSLDATKLYIRLVAIENAFKSGRFFHLDGSKWTAEEAEAALDLIRRQVSVPVRPLNLRVESVAAAEEVVPPAHLAPRPFFIPTLSFTTLYLIFRLASTGIETVTVLRRLDASNNIFGYVHLIDIKILFNLLSYKGGFSTYYRTHKTGHNFWEYCRLFRCSDAHLNQSAKSKRQAKETSSTVAGMASGTTLFMFCLLVMLLIIRDVQSIL